MRFRANIASGIVLVIATVLAMGAWLSIARASNDDAAAVMQSSRAIFAAFNKHDAAGMAQFQSSDYVHIHDDGTLTGRDDQLQFDPYPETADWTSQHVRFIGDVAVITGTQEETVRYVDGKQLNHYYRTEVWKKSSGRWLLEQSQVTIIPPVNHPLTVPTPKHLEQYAGRYEWWPGYVETMSEKDGQLYSTLGGPTPDLLYWVGPESTTTTDDPGIGTFYRDSTGRVAGYIYRTCYGQAVRIPRIR